MDIAVSLSQLSQNHRTLMTQAADRAQMEAEKRKAVGDAVIQQQLQTQQRAIVAGDVSLTLGRNIDTRA